ncbi:hypothetical protein [Reichenbachiella ulvae]|uniref:Etoposide-induced protein 2.4 (EI24) n=1 Tax=Reichenbachiella ulvae TaxID=2980104 RepID=A0ABT3CXK7_9BACT|nr:hypothetical protein [Reichenbachiella ulvae]MCV9388367.1 hypothetical protein [Reichenbachiella ulvae]
MIRLLTEAGLWRTILLVMIVACVSVFAFISLSQKPNVYYVLGITMTLLSGLHYKRSDIVFLHLISARTFVILLLEYIVLLLPLLIMLAVYGWWLSMLVLISFALVISLVPSESNPLSKIRNPLPQAVLGTSFEWKAGVRKFGYLLLLLVLIGLGASFFLFSVPLAIFLIGLIVYGFYEKSEHYALLIVFERRPSAFLWLKVTQVVLQFSVLIAPLVLAFVWMHSSLWYIVVIEWLIFLFVFNYTVLLKYAFYKSNPSDKVPPLFAALGLGSFFLPPLLLLIWILSIYFCRKSLSNLSIYIDDFD